MPRLAVKPQDSLQPFLESTRVQGRPRPDAESRVDVLLGHLVVAQYFHVLDVGPFPDRIGQGSLGGEIRAHVIEKPHPVDGLDVTVHDILIEREALLRLNAQADGVLFDPQVPLDTDFVDHGGSQRQTVPCREPEHGGGKHRGNSFASVPHWPIPGKDLDFPVFC